jgi:hypothetical protein
MKKDILRRVVQWRMPFCFCSTLLIERKMPISQIYQFFLLERALSPTNGLFTTIRYPVHDGKKLWQRLVLQVPK